MNTRMFKALNVAVIAIFLMGLAPRLLAEAPIPQIRVSGQAEVSIAPDMAVLQLTVMREADTARAALDANSKAMAEVIEAMREGDVAERDLQTSNFSIQPRYIYPKPRNEKPPELVGYTVRNSLTVRVRDLDELGALLDKSVSLGVNEGGNVQFTNDDPSAALTQARSRAVKDAMARAQTMADAADVDLGDVMDISEQTHMPQPRPYRAERAMAMSASADAVPVMAGENSYQVVVNMSFAIDQ
ncbi:MAG: SIMPL domain-containing protein [Halioglobus sp.]